MKYKTVTSTDRDAFDLEVNELLAEGWLLYWAPMMGLTPMTEWVSPCARWSQAMTWQPRRPLPK